MATEFNPGGPINRDSAARERINHPTAAPARNNRGMIFAIAAIAALVVAGMMFSMRDSNTPTANTSPGVTTGASPSNPPAAPGPQGQGESNSTR